MGGSARFALGLRERQIWVKAQSVGPGIREIDEVQGRTWTNLVPAADLSLYDDEPAGRHAANSRSCQCTRQFGESGVVPANENVVEAIVLS